MHKTEKAHFVLNKYFKSTLFSRSTKVRLCRTIVRPSVTYGCQVCPTTLQLEKKRLKMIYQEKYVGQSSTANQMGGAGEKMSS